MPATLAARSGGTILLACASALWSLEAISTVSTASTGGPVPLAVHRVDLNTASTAELGLLPGIGPALADRIAADRVERGAFLRWDDIERVKGIGPAVLEGIAPHVTLGEAGPGGDRPER